MSLINDAVTARAAALFFDRMADRLEARAMLASAWSVTLGRMCGCDFQPASQPWTASMPANGRAQVDLGEGYTLEFNEAKSQILIKNAATGEVTNIWGDPHIDWNQDGRTDADFWGTTTFQLENGVKITIETEPYDKNPNEYLASRVTITKGDNVVVVDGVSQNDLGDLSVTMGQNGRLADLMTDDGFLVTENPFGEGWINPETGRLATQRDFDVTKPGAGAPTFDGEFSSAISGFLLMGFIAGVFATMDGYAEAQESAEALAPWLRPDFV